jgi:hypothetical protein
VWWWKDCKSGVWTPNLQIWVAKTESMFSQFWDCLCVIFQDTQTSNPVLSSGDIIWSGVLWSSSKCLAGACSESNVNCVPSLMLFCNPKCAHKTRKNWIHVQIYLENIPLEHQQQVKHWLRGDSESLFIMLLWSQQSNKKMSLLGPSHIPVKNIQTDMWRLGGSLPPEWMDEYRDAAAFYFGVKSQDQEQQCLHATTHKGGFLSNKITISFVRLYVKHSCGSSGTAFPNSPPLRLDLDPGPHVPRSSSMNEHEGGR